jgi:hypothetical protein
MTADDSTALLCKYAKSALDYDPDSGRLTWKVRTSSRNWPGKPAGHIGGDGYLKVRVLGRTYQAHRVIWLMMHGSWPIHQVDHINGNRTDNRASNLRDIEGRHNSQNMRAPMSSNTSGLLGVSFQKRSKKNPWIAYISVSKKTIYLGGFPTREAAHAAYVAAKRELHEACTL